MFMKGKKLTRYAATGVVILLGTGAIVLLVHAAFFMNTKRDYADVDPIDINVDFENLKKSP